jgi:gamma-glutamyltranspeptidase
MGAILSARGRCARRLAWWSPTTQAAGVGVAVLKSGVTVDAAVAVGFALRLRIPTPEAPRRRGFMPCVSRMAIGVYRLSESAPGKATRDAAPDANRSTQNPSMAGER